MGFRISNFYLDSMRTHSYMKYLYKYPQRAYPYADMVETNRRRSRNEFEYELLDTGVFDDDRCFDVFVEYAKGDADNTLVQITAANRGLEKAELHVLPTLWFRNNWAPWISKTNRVDNKPNLRQIAGPVGTRAVAVTHPLLGQYTFLCESAGFIQQWSVNADCGRSLTSLPTTLHQIAKAD